MHDYLRRGSNSILIRCSRSSISVAHIRRTLGTRFCTTLPNRIFLVITPCIACCSYATESPATPCFRAFCSYTYSRCLFSKLVETIVSSDAFRMNPAFGNIFHFNQSDVVEESFNRLRCRYFCRMIW